MWLLFDLIFLIYALLYLPVLFFSGKWHAGFRERLGFLPSETLSRLTAKENIWIHAVSVGEVIAIDGLIQKFRAAYPRRQIVLSVTTMTGHSLARRKYSKDVLIIWSPLDLSWIVRRFVKAIRPDIYIAAETELWPNLFRCLVIENIPAVVINGRISDEAYPRYRLVGWLLRGTLKGIRLFCMQSPQDAERIVALGAQKSSVKMVGNVKFDNVPGSKMTDPREFGFDPARAVLVGGSTHPGEEEILLDIFQSLRPKYPMLRLALAPRHPERAASIAKAVEKCGLKPIFFSSNKSLFSADCVLIVDTIGHLLNLYSVATVVFVGKSLLVKGGHNIIEPAVFGKPIVIGPHMQNFRDIAQAFKSEKAVIQVEDVLALKRAIIELLENANLRQDLGTKALGVIRKHQGATQRTMEQIQAILLGADKKV